MKVCDHTYVKQNEISSQNYLQPLVLFISLNDLTLLKFIDTFIGNFLLLVMFCKISSLYFLVE